jgi:hypothetical protein
MPAGGGDPYKEFKIEQRAIEKEVWECANNRQKDRERRADNARKAGLPTPPPTEYSLSEYSLVTDHSLNQNGPLYLLSGVNPYWKKPARSASDTVLQGKGSIVRKGPDAAVKIMPSLCGTLQHNRYQNNLPYVETLKEGKPTLEDLLADPQAPTRTRDGRDPFASDADQATNYLPRYREPVEDVSKIGTWRMKTVLGKTIWYLDVPQEEKERQALSFQDSLAAFQKEFEFSEKDKRRSKTIRNRSRTYEPRNPNTGGWYTTLLGSC